MTLTFSAALLALVMAFLLWERRARDAALAAIPVRVHVNGTRGKSTVTRLIAGALREAGIRTVAKTTGSAPRIILPDGSERPVRRRAPASIREQLWLLREARRLGAEAIVVECMAVDPELQEMCETRMIRSTIGVVTNVRLDHAEAMGRTLDEVAQALASTVPRGGTLVIGPTDGAARLENAAALRGSRVLRATAAVGAPGAWAGQPWMADNAGVALAVARALGIGDETALRGLSTASPDPGALQTDCIEMAGRRVDVVDASAANDPQSLGLILGTRREATVFVFQHRADRPGRLAQFSDAAPWSRADDAVVVTGDRPDWSTWRSLRRRMPGERAVFAGRRALASELRRRLTSPEAPRLLVFCGNTKGIRVDAIVAALHQTCHG